MTTTIRISRRHRFVAALTTLAAATGPVALNAGPAAAGAVLSNHCEPTLRIR